MQINDKIRQHHFTKLQDDRTKLAILSQKRHPFPKVFKKLKKYQFCPIQSLFHLIVFTLYYRIFAEKDRQPIFQNTTDDTLLP